MFTILEHLSSSQFFVLLNHQFSVCYLVGHCLSFHSFSLVIVCPFILFHWLLFVLSFFFIGYCLSFHSFSLVIVCPFILFHWLLSVLSLLWLWITLLLPSNFFYDYSEMKKRAFRLLSFMFIYIYILLYIVFNI